MGNKKIIKFFSICVLIITVITLLLSIFYNSAFLSSTMFMGALTVFSYCYYIYEDKDKKNMLYILFIVGVLLIIGALVYTFMRIM